MTKKLKKPKDLLINSVLDDLKNETADPSIHGRTKSTNASAFGSAFLGSSKDNDYSSKKEADYTNNTKLGEAPEGLFNSTNILADAAPSKHTREEPALPVPEVASSSDKTVVLDPSPIANKKLAISDAAGATEILPPAQTPTAIAGPTVLLPAAPAIEPRARVYEAPPEQHRAAPAPTQNQNQRALAYEAQFLQAENLKLAQQRIIELEKDIERLRKESEILTSANEIAKNKTEDLLAKVQAVDRQKFELKETNESELRIFKEGLIAKDNEIHRLRTKVEELEGRLANDLRKIRVRERELENRLELSKLEKTALIRSKDETILELKRRSESLEGDIETFQHKILELSQKIEGNQEQFSRTVRALRIALTNLEVNENTSSITLAPLKKAQ